MKEEKSILKVLSLAQSVALDSEPGCVDDQAPVLRGNDLPLHRLHPALALALFN